MSDFKENCLEWLTGQDTITATLTQKAFIGKVLKLAENPESGVEITAKNADGSIVAHLPIKALHLAIYKGNPSNLKAFLESQEEDEADED